MNAPRLRFKEFSGAWEVKKIEEIATVSSGGTPSRANKEFWNGEIPWVTTSEVKFNSIRDTEQKITEKGLKSSSAKVFPKDTLLIAMYGQGKTRGQIAKLEIDASTNQACAAILLKKTHNPDFFFQYLQNQYENIRNLSNDGGQKNLSASLIKYISVAFPTLPEQTKIANFLTAVDEKIAQLTQKADLLARYKKGVMQQIFSQQLRFKDDDGREFSDWEEKSLIELSENGFSNGVFNDPTKVGRGYKLINVIDMYIDSTINEDTLTLVELNETEFLKNKAEYGDIFFTRSSLVKEGIAYSNVYLNNSDDVTFDGHLIKMKPKKNLINSVFLNYILKTPKIRCQFVMRGKTATMTTIGQADIATVIVSFPSIPEQTKIANFLTALDDKITHNQTQLNAVKEYKQGLLQQLFV